jgi:hypothetical protein
MPGKGWNEKNVEESDRGLGDFSQELRKTTKNIGQDSQGLDRGSNRRPSE